MKKINLILPEEEKYKKLKVAAYCRVSTKRLVQLKSLEQQVSTYKEIISNHPNWIFAGIFYDIGKSGLRKRGRIGLDTMLKKAGKGKIDYIVTKSISRVSRDTVEILKIIRYLRERGINMYFENENLNSIDAKVEFEITIRGMLAQEESRNTSENIQWGLKRRFENGNIFTKYKNFMGYTCIDGAMVIVPEQAEIVRIIFNLYLQGLTLSQIKLYLESQQIKTVTGNSNWDTSTIQKMLKNEKYKGDSVLQKTYTKDFMSGKKAKNIGQRTRYYVSDSHPAIVSAEIFDKVQEEMEKRARLIYNEDGSIVSGKSKYSGKYLLGNLLICGDCGASYRRRTERGKVVWRCATRIEKGKENCQDSPTIYEEWVKKVVGEEVCENGIYNERDVKNKVEKIEIYKEFMVVKCKDGNDFKSAL